MTDHSAALLRVRDLEVRLADGRPVVRDLAFELRRGRVLAVVGPSGAGKTLAVRAVAGLLPRGVTAAGSVRLGDVELVGRPERWLRPLRGRRVAWVGQDATASLNPVITVGRHLSESARAVGVSPDRARTAMAEVGLDAETLWRSYPFELSGGQAQRVALALATVGDPDVLLADEVTASLDVVSAAEVLDLLRAQADTGRAVLLVTHDLAAAGRWSDDVLVVEDGRVVESGGTAEVLTAPRSALVRSWLAVAR